jgi:hypothetical protein
LSDGGDLELKGEMTLLGGQVRKRKVRDCFFSAEIWRSAIVDTYTLRKFQYIYC